MLGWSRSDFAEKAGLSLNTIRNLEAGNISPRSATNLSIRNVFEKAGLEFIEGEGVRFRLDGIRMITGLHSCDVFYEELLATAQQDGGEILAIFQTCDMMMEACDGSESGSSRWTEIAQVVPVKCLVSEEEKLGHAALVEGTLEIRSFNAPLAGPIYSVIYGDNQALVVPDDVYGFRYIVIQSSRIARCCRTRFHAMWQETTMRDQRNARNARTR